MPSVATSTSTSVARRRTGTGTTTVSSSVTGRTTAAAAAAAASARARAAETASLARDALEEGRNFLVGLLEEVEQVPDDATVAAVEEGRRHTRVPGATGTADAVHVVVNVRRQVVVHDVGHVGDVETTSGHGGGDQNRVAAGAEHLKGTLALALGAVAVDRRGREALLDEEIR